MGTGALEGASLAFAVGTPAAEPATHDL
jgi:hypothetical protein